MACSRCGRPASGYPKLVPITKRKSKPRKKHSKKKTHHPVLLAGARTSPPQRPFAGRGGHCRTCQCFPHVHQPEPSAASQLGTSRTSAIGTNCVLGRPEHSSQPNMHAGRVLAGIGTATEHTTLRGLHNRLGSLRGLKTATNSEMFRNTNCSPARECGSVRNTVADCSRERPPSPRAHLPPHSAKPQPMSPCRVSTARRSRRWMVSIHKFFVSSTAKSERCFQATVRKLCAEKLGGEFPVARSSRPGLTSCYLLRSGTRQCGAS